MGPTRTNARVEPREAPWTSHLRVTDEALARGDVRAAVEAWDEAHLAAAGSLRWDGLIEVGDAYLRIGRVTGLPAAATATARKAYFAALFRACQRDSLDGVLQAAQAFAGLGDQEVVDECVGLAELLAGNDGGARSRIRTVAPRLRHHASLLRDLSGPLVARPRAVAGA